MEFYKRENNNFNVVRMLAAYMVIYAHAYTIQPNGKWDIICTVSKCTHAGQIAVFIFTFLSGIYIMKSLFYEESVCIFYLKRFMRIWPMLLLAVLGVIWMGAIFTTLPVKDYFLSAEVRRYFVKNLWMVENEHFLPGVFANHANGGVNGVLWFITFQARIYLIMGILKSMGLFEERMRSNAALLSIMTWAMAMPQSLPLIGSNRALWGNEDFPQYVVTFIIGAIVFLNYPALKIKFWHVTAIIIVCLAIRMPENSLPCWAITGCFAALWLGTNKFVMKFKIPDYSYGIFLFAWPISQIYVELFPKAKTWMNILFTIVCSTFWAMVLNVTFEKKVHMATEKITGRMSCSFKKEAAAKNNENRK